MHSLSFSVYIFNDLSCVCSCRVAEKEPINKMSLHNLATVFGPTLLRPSESESTKGQHITSASDIWSHDVMAQVATNRHTPFRQKGHVYFLNIDCVKQRQAFIPKLVSSALFPTIWLIEDEKSSPLWVYTVNVRLVRTCTFPRHFQMNFTPTSLSDPCHCGLVSQLYLGCRPSIHLHWEMSFLCTNVFSW